MDSVSGKTCPTINPVTEEKICDVAEGDKVGTDVQNNAMNARYSTSHVN